MFSVTVRDHVMIAHSLRGEVFGPAQSLRCATYVVGCHFLPGGARCRQHRGRIGRARDLLQAVLGDFNYRNLDESPTSLA